MYCAAQNIVQYCIQAEGLTRYRQTQNHEDADNDDRNQKQTAGLRQNTFRLS